MTLLKQLCLYVIILFSIMFTVTFYINVISVEKYAREQLASHAQDTASSLGLSLSKHLEHNDKIMIERSIDAIFDRGDYLSITLTDVDNEVLYELKNPVKKGDMPPDWFVNFIHLESPQKTAFIKKQWKNMGTITVASHPANVLNELWWVCQETFWMFLICGILTILFSIGILRYILKPVRIVTNQAESICNREFPVSKYIPWTTDFRVVVIAMNKLSTTLKQIFEEHNEHNTLLRERAYKDPLTQIGNRRYFESQCEHLIARVKEGIGGKLVLIRVTNFNEYNQKWGLEHTNALLKEVGHLLNQLTENFELSIVAYIGGADFVAVKGNMSKESVPDLCNLIIYGFENLEHKDSIKSPVECSIGVTQFESTDSVNNLLSKADMALRVAVKDGINRWYSDGELKASDYLSDIDWSALLDGVIKNKRVVPFYQPVTILDEEHDKETIYHFEMLMRIPATRDELIGAGIFIPIAESTGRIIELDKIMVEMAMEKIRLTHYHFAVNLSAYSIEDPNFVLWFSQQCARTGNDVERLSIEIPEFRVRGREEALYDFIQCASAYNIKVGLDNFGCGFSSFAYLDHLRFDYIKIDASFSHGLEGNENNQFILRSFSEIAHGLDMLAIATGLETVPEMLMAKKLHMNGLQGNVVRKPTREIKDKIG